MKLTENLKEFGKDVLGVIAIGALLIVSVNVVSDAFSSQLMDVID